MEMKVKEEYSDIIDDYIERLTSKKITPRDKLTEAKEFISIHRKKRVWDYSSKNVRNIIVYSFIENNIKIFKLFVDEKNANLYTPNNKDNTLLKIVLNDYSIGMQKDRDSQAYADYLIEKGAKIPKDYTNHPLVSKYKLGSYSKFLDL